MENNTPPSPKTVTITSDCLVHSSSGSVFLIDDKGNRVELHPGQKLQPGDKILVVSGSLNLLGEDNQLIVLMSMDQVNLQDDPQPARETQETAADPSTPKELAEDESKPEQDEIQKVDQTDQVLQSGVVLPFKCQLTSEEVTAGSGAETDRLTNISQGHHGTLGILSPELLVYQTDPATSANLDQDSGSRLHQSFTIPAIALSPTAHSGTGTTTSHQGGPATTHLTLTVSGSGTQVIPPHAAQISGVDTGSVTEDVKLSTTGKLTISDPNPGEDHFIQEVQQGNEGTFSIGTDGRWTFTANNSSPTLQSLGAGESLKLTFTARSADGTQHQLSVAIHGTNDVPVLGAISSQAVTEGGQALHGTLAASDIDHGDTLSFSSPSPAKGLTINSDGSYTFDPTDPAYNQLAAGQNQVLTIPVTVTDSQGAATSQNLQITVTGTDDAATIGGTATGGVIEDSNLQTAGTLTVTDPDAGQAEFVPQTGAAGSYGTFSVDAKGQWNYHLDNTNPQVQALKTSDQVTDTITVTTKDGTSQQITVTVNGTDDQAQIGGTATGGVTEDSHLQTAGTLTVADPDAGQAEFVPQTGATGSYGTFSVDANGQWNYHLDNTNPQVQGLKTGDQVTDTITVTTKDGTSQQITVTVNGTDDQALIGGTATGGVTEDSNLQTAGSLTVIDPDVGQAEFVPQTGAAGSYGTFSVDAKGQWNYHLDNTNPQVQALKTGDQVTDTITVTTKDGTSQQITVTVNGTDDQAQIGGTAVGSVTEESQLTTGGQLTVTDPDAGQAEFVPQTAASGSYGTFTLDAKGQWNYHLDNTNPQVQALKTGAQVTDTITVSSKDGTSHDIHVTINGTNDAPVLAAQSHAVTEDGSLLSGQMVATDQDTGDTLTYAPLTQQVDGFTLNPDGSYTFDPTDQAYQHLAAGQTEVVRIPITVTDAEHATSTQNLEITVTGTNDTPKVSGATTLAPGTEDTSVTLHAADLLSHATDVDSTDTLSVTNLHTTHGKIASNPDGSFTFTPDKDYNGPVSFTYDVTDSHGGTVQTSASMNLAAVGDSATFSGDDSGSLKEDVNINTATSTPRLYVSGYLGVHDPDAGQDHFQFSQFGEHAVHDPFGGHLQIDRAGSWAYTVDNNNSALQQLSEGQTEVVTYRVRSADGTTHNINITVTGTNDAPVLQAQSQSVTEDGSLLAGQMAATDVDTGDTLTYSPPTQQVDGFTLNTDGSYTFNPTDQAYQHLAAGQTEKVTIPVTVTDSAGEKSTDTLEITVTGTNDAPAVSAATVLPAGTEDTSVTLHAPDLLTHATDVDTTDTLSVANLNADHGAVVDNKDGTFTFTPDPNYNGPVSLTYEVTDGQGGSVQTSATMDLASVGDAAKITGQDTGDVTEDRKTYSAVSFLANQIHTSGQLSVTDPDSGEGHFGFKTFIHAAMHPEWTPYTSALGGQVSITPNGQWEYIIDTTKPEIQQLGDKDTLTDTVKVHSVDGTEHTITITIHGTNDIPVLQAQSQSVTEDGSLLAGQMAATDLDTGDTLTYSPPTQQVDGFTLNTDGSYTFDPTDQAYQHLATGQTEKVTIPVTVTDSQGAASTQNLEITVTGTNDAPVVSGATSLASGTEDTAVTLHAADLLSHVTDVDTTDTLSVTNLKADHGSITSNPDGSFTFTPSPDYNGPVSLTYVVTDGQGGTVKTSAAMNLASVGDAAVITGQDSATLKEDVNVEQGYTLGAQGHLTVTDPDAGEAKIVEIPFPHPLQTNTPQGGQFQIYSNGNWYYHIYHGMDGENTKIQHLREGESLTDTIKVTSADGTTHTITVTIQGTNDAPVLQAQTQSIAEGGQMLQGQMVATDVDTGDTQSFSATNHPAGFTLNKDGSYTFNPTDQAYQHLAAGQTEKITIPVTVTDSQGATSTQNLEITVSGTNDAPVVTPITDHVDEDVASHSIDLLSGATDPEGDSLAVSGMQFTVNGAATSGLPPGLTIDADGHTLHIDTTGQAYQHLAAGQQEHIQVSYLVDDGKGGQTQQTAALTVEGQDDKATLVSNVIQISETVAYESSMIGHTVSGHLQLTDPDDGSPREFAFSGAYAGQGYAPGNFTIWPDGSYKFNLDWASNRHARDVVNSLKSGETLEYKYNIQTADHQTKEVIIRITGEDDSARIAVDPVLPARQTVTEDHFLPVGHGVDLYAGGILTVIDPDHDEAGVKSQNITTPEGGHFRISESGSWSFVIDNSLPVVQQLGAGETIVKTFTVESIDGSATHDIQITIQGTNDTPVLQAQSQSVTEDGSLLSGQMTATDADTGDTQNFSPGSQVAGFSMKLDGSYTFDPSDQAYQHLVAGQTEKVTIPVTVTDSQGATSTQYLDITVTGTNDTPVVSSATTLAPGTEDTTVTLHAGDLLSHATDADATDTLIVQNINADHGTVSTNPDGSFTFTPDKDYNGPVSLTYDVTDGHGGSVQTSASMNLVPTGDQAIISGNDRGTVTEEHIHGMQWLETNGKLDITDPDPGEARFVGDSRYQPAYTTAMGGSLVIGPDGQWNYIIDNNNSAIQQLGKDDTTVDRVTVRSADGTTHEIQVTIHGTNDAPVLQAQSQSVTEDGSLLHGQMQATDVDTGNSQHFSPTGHTAGFTLHDDGSYTFNPTDPAYQHLAEGVKEVVTIPVTVTDGAGAQSTENLQITVTGTNDAPVVSGTTDLGATDQGQPVPITQAQLLAQVTDVDGDHVSISSVSVDPAAGSVSNNPDGSFTFTPAAGFTGDNLPVTFTATDGSASTQGAAVIDVRPTINHAPVIDQAQFTSHKQGANLVGSMGVTDTDSKDTHTWAVIGQRGNPGAQTHGQFGTFSIDEHSGAFTYAPDGGGSSVQKSGAMPPPGQVADSFVVAVTDSGGLSHEMQVDVMVETGAHHVHGASGHWVARIVPLGASLSPTSSADEVEPVDESEAHFFSVEAQIAEVTHEIDDHESRGKDSGEARAKLAGLTGTSPVSDSDQTSHEHDSPAGKDQSQPIDADHAPGLADLVREEHGLTFDNIQAAHQDERLQSTTAGGTASQPQTDLSDDQSAPLDKTHNQGVDDHDSDDTHTSNKPLQAGDVLAGDDDNGVDKLLAEQPEKDAVPADDAAESGAGPAVEPSKSQQPPEGAPDSSTLDATLVDGHDDHNV